MESALLSSVDHVTRRPSISQQAQYDNIYMFVHAVLEPLDLRIAYILRPSSTPFKWTQSLDYGYVPSPQRHLGRTGYPPQVKSRKYGDPMRFFDILL